MQSRWGVKYAAVALAILSFLLLSPSAQSTQNTGSFTSTCIINGQTITPAQCIAAAVPYMAIGVLFSFMVIAIVYMLGNVLQFKSLQDWYKAELWEAIKTILMIAIIISALVVMSALADILVGAQYTAPGSGSPDTALSSNLANLYAADNTYIGQQLNLSYQAYSAVLGLSTGVGILSSLSVSLWVPIPIPIIPPWDGAVQFGVSSAPIFRSNYITSAGGGSYSLTQNITGLVVVPMLIFFQVQANYFYDIVALGLGILIPIGIIFRAFPLIRDIGGTLIATGIGMALVYPILLLVLNQPISNYIYNFTYAQTLNSDCPFSSGLMCVAWNGAMNLIGAAPVSAVTAASPLTAPAALVKTPVTVALGTVASSNANVIGAANGGLFVGLSSPLTEGVYPTMNFILANTLGMILQTILVAIDLLVGLIVTGAVNQMLGGKIRLGFGNKLSIT